MKDRPDASSARPRRAPPAVVLLAVALAGCEGECAHPWFADLDGDGYGDPDALLIACERPETHVADASDCDDRTAARNPAVPDLCNGVDDNCDGEIDPGAATWYPDLDGDGWGDGAPVTTCFAPDHHVDRAGDCDDADPSAHPDGGPEVCDGVDQDCDGLVDEGAPGDTVWYPDEDHDGFGVPGGGMALCDPPPWWVKNALDCADDDASINPLVFETCNGIDDDCDLAVDLDDPDGVLGTIFVYTDLDGDGYGTGALVARCFVGPGESEIAGDCDDTAPAVHPEAAEVCDAGVDDDCDGLADDADPSIDLATTFAAWPDLDGDGYGDPDAPIDVCALVDGVVTNDFDCNDGDPLLGADLWVEDLDADGVGAGVPAAGLQCTPPAEGYVNLARAGDCDDGDAAFRPGAPDACEDGIDHDCSTVDPACGAPFAGIEALEARGRTWADGGELGAGFAATVGGGADLDGDGVPDLAVGAPATGGGLGAVHLFSGPPPEAGHAWLARQIIPAPAGGGFGGAVLVAPGTTASHLLVGAPEYDIDNGRIYVYTAGASVVTTEVTGTGGIGGALALVVGGDTPQVALAAPALSVGGVITLDLASAAQAASTADLVLRSTVGDGFGEAIATTNDVYAVAYGAVGAAGDPGSVWIFDSTEVGDFLAADVASVHVVGVGADDQLGAAVAAGGDFDGDGRPDFAGSAPGSDASASDAGAVYVWTAVFGEGIADEAALEVRGDGVDARIGQAVRLADLDGDGSVELVFGAADVDIGGTDSGAVYVFTGGTTGVWDALAADAVWYGPAGGQAGASLVAADVDPDPGADLWIGLPGATFGTAWYVAGPVP